MKREKYEEEIARMSEEEMDEMADIARKRTTVLLVIAIPLALFLIIGLIYMPSDPGPRRNYLIGYAIFLVVGIVVVLGVLMGFRLKYPEFDPQLARYISKYH